jgi:hypothetical protein
MIYNGNPLAQPLRWSPDSVGVPISLAAVQAAGRSLTSTANVQLPVNCVMDYLQPGREGGDPQIPENIIKKIFNE